MLTVQDTSMRGWHNAIVIAVDSKDVAAAKDLARQTKIESMCASVLYHNAKRAYDSVKQANSPRIDDYGLRIVKLQRDGESKNQHFSRRPNRPDEISPKAQRCFEEAAKLEAERHTLLAEIKTASTDLRQARDSHLRAIKDHEIATQLVREALGLI